MVDGSTNPDWGSRWRSLPYECGLVEDEHGQLTGVAVARHLMAIFRGQLPGAVAVVGVSQRRRLPGSVAVVSVS